MDDAPDTAADQRVGVDTVDQVLASLSGLDALPVDQHVAVFERAHEGLRRALDSETGSSVPAALRPQR
ncbi:hypothetical protein [Nocardioides sp.]|uniref:hypothetical protein n=1 Tax=Nocardioides sp. TaxID=35761 RepID=UPI00273262B2|nr:hypothetical protein [Nocardioides sp.]MDP3891476.1 hypothetical protein [Nocardioides sp.]